MLTIHGIISLVLRPVGIIDSSCASIIPHLSKKPGARNIRTIEPFLEILPNIPKLPRAFRLISTNMLFFK